MKIKSLKNSIPSILVIILLSCNSHINQNEDPNYIIKVFAEKDIPEESFLEGKKFTFDQFLFPRHILVIDDYFVVAEKGVNDIFYLYNIETEEFIRSFGTNGLGPGEITMANPPQKGLKKGDFWVYDSNGRTFNIYNIYNDSSKLANTQIRQSEQLTAITEITPSTDSTFMTKQMERQEKFLEVDFEGNQINSFGDWDMMLKDKDVSAGVKFIVHQGKLTSSQDRNYFGMCGSWRDFIEILNKKSGQILSIRGPLNMTPEFELEYSRKFAYPERKSSEIYYRGLHLGDSSIFALYSGRTNKEDFEEGNPQSTFFKFDYEGNILNKYTVQHRILSFSIDEKRKRIYAVEFDEHPNVVMFNYN